MSALTVLRRLGTTALCAAALVQSASAGDAEGRFAPKGPGLMPCSMFLQQLQNQPEAATIPLVWLTGYLSGANAFLDDTYDLVTWQSEGILANIMASACAQNPDQPIAVAANAVVQALGPGRLRTAEQPEKITVGEQEGILYPSVVRAVQQRLADNGQSLVVDGDFGPGTATAIRAFQKSKGIAESGYPDAMTMVALFTNAPTN